MAIKNNLSDREERIAMVKAMEYIARQVNDENGLMTWLMNGVADEDIPYADFQYRDGGEDDMAQFYVDDDKDFGDLMAAFLRLMAYARRFGGLYCGGAVSTPRNPDAKPFAHVKWTNADLRMALEDAGVPTTSENVQILKGEILHGRYRLQDNMIETGWNTIHDAVNYLNINEYFKA